MAAGVDQHVRRCTDRDVAFPEHQISALEIGIIIIRFDDFAERVLLHVRIAQDLAARNPHGKLHDTGAIDTETRCSTPEIRRMQQGFSNCNIVCRMLIKWRKMACNQGFAILKQCILRAACFSGTNNAHTRAKRKCLGMRKTKIRAGIDECARHDHHVSRICGWLFQRC
ncbi:hypothetical protein D9M70_573010 [compost metagenome]